MAQHISTEPAPFGITRDDNNVITPLTSGALRADPKNLPTADAAFRR